MFIAQTDKVHQLVLRIRRVGVMHRRTAIAEAPFWPKQRFTGQANEGFSDIQYALAGEQIVIDVASFRLPAAIGGMVIIDFVTEIQPAAAQVIVKQAVADIATLRDGKWNMFIQRVGAHRVIPHRVEVTHLIAFAGTLQIARLLTQTVEALIFTSAQVVSNAVAVRIRQIGAGRAVVRQRLPLAGFIAIAPFQPQRLVDDNAQLFGGDTEGAFLFRELPGGEAKAA